MRAMVADGAASQKRRKPSQFLYMYMALDIFKDGDPLFNIVHNAAFSCG